MYLFCSKCMKVKGCSNRIYKKTSKTWLCSKIRYISLWTGPKVEWKYSALNDTEATGQLSSRSKNWAVGAGHSVPG